MNAHLHLDSADRLLILAPHPDDESIATGALLQSARALGARSRVVVLTDGDNNPWPQRWVEKRWHIGPPDRARWGARRREEARAAMHILGVGDEDRRFLGLPDQGLTDLLMRADAQVIDALRTQIAEAMPSVLVLPALGDCHPDHSATNILARLALAQSSAATPRILEFAVHGHAAKNADIVVASNVAQRAVKHAAILAHTSQMRLSQRRFLRYVTTPEAFVAGAADVDPQHPLHASIDAEGLQVRIDVRRWNARLRGQTLFVVLESDDDKPVRGRIQLDASSSQVPVLDTMAECATLSARIRCERNHVALTLPIKPSSGGCRGYVKLARTQPGLRIFDRFGWQSIEFPERISVSA